MDNIDDRLKAHTAYDLMLLEEKLESLIMENKLKRSPNDMVEISKIVFLKNNRMEIKGER